MTDSETPQAAAPDRVLWFYRALAVRRKATVFVSAAPAEPDVPLWLRAAKAVAAQRARWCEGAECGGVSLFVGIDGHGAPRASVVAAVVGTDVRLTQNEANEPFVAAALRLIAQRASTRPIGFLGEVLEAATSAPPPSAPLPEDAPTPSAPPVDAPTPSAPPVDAPDERAAGPMAELARAAGDVREAAPCVSCRAVWCAWCRGGEVLAAGRAYGGEPEPLDFPGLAFALRLRTMALLPTDAEDGAAIRAGLDAAVGPGLWCGQKIVDEDAAADPPTGVPEPFDGGVPFYCLCCFDGVCHAYARSINVALPASPPQRESAAARALVRVLCGAEPEPKRPRHAE